jgi:hypothetical protein
VWKQCENCYLSKGTTTESEVADTEGSTATPSLVELPVSGRLPYGQSYEDIYHIEEPTGNPQTLTNIIGEDSTGSRHSGNHKVEVLQEALPSGEGSTIQDQGMPEYNPSPQMRGIMEREFTPRRADETESQYENRYLAHQRRITNTQQSWARSGYDIPLHLDSVSNNFKRTEHRFGRGVPIPV